MVKKITPQLKTMQELEYFRNLWRGFWVSRLILTANNMQLFDILDDAPKNAKQVANELKLDKRACEFILNAFVSIDFMLKKAGKYQNTEFANHYLVTKSPFYQGEILKHANSLWENWSQLDQAVKNGQVENVATCATDVFIKCMHKIASFKLKPVFSNIDFTGISTVLDLGGGSGAYALEFARRGYEVTFLDSLEVLQTAQKLFSDLNESKVNFIANDFILHKFSNKFDLIFISQLIHYYSPEQNIKLLKKCKKILNPGGKIVIHDFYIDNNKTSPSENVLFSINMLVENKGGGCYSAAEIKEWLQVASISYLTCCNLGNTMLVQAINDS